MQGEKRKATALKDFQEDYAYLDLGVDDAINGHAGKLLTTMKIALNGAVQEPDEMTEAYEDNTITMMMKEIRAKKAVIIEAAIKQLDAVMDKQYNKLVTTYLINADSSRYTTEQVQVIINTIKGISNEYLDDAGSSGWFVLGGGVETAENPAAAAAAAALARAGPA